MTFGRLVVAQTEPNNIGEDCLDSTEGTPTSRSMTSARYIAINEA